MDSAHDADRDRKNLAAAKSSYALRLQLFQQPGAFSDCSERIILAPRHPTDRLIETISQSGVSLLDFVQCPPTERGALPLNAERAV